MSYVRTTWQNGDTITAAKLNNIETGILGNESDISDLNTNLSGDIDDLQGTVASTYDSTSTYAVGDYVYYNDVLYRCTTAITTAESWTAGHWTSAVLGNDVIGLKSDIDEITDEHISSNRLNLDAITADTYINVNGSSTASANFSVTDYIPVTAGETIYFWDKRQDGFYLFDARFLCAYDSSKTVVSASGGTWVPGEYTVPNGIAYVRLSISNTYLSTYSNFYVGILPLDDCDQYEPYGTTLLLINQPQVDGNTTVINALTKTSTNLLDLDSITPNTYIVADGTESSVGTLSVTDYIPVNVGDVLYGWGYSNHAYAPITFRCVCAYNSNKEPVTASGYSNETTPPYTVPSGIAYLRITLRNEVLAYQKLYIGTNTIGVDYEPYGTLLKISDQVNANTEALDNITTKSSNLLDLERVTPNVYIQTDGTITGIATLSATDYIPVSEGDSLYGWCREDGTYVVMPFRLVCAYDSSKTPIPASGWSNEMNPPYTVPSGVAFVRITLRNTSLAYDNLYIGSHNIGYKYEPYGTVVKTTEDNSNAYHSISNGDSILEAVKYCYANGISNLIVEAGTYDVISEYESYYGATYFDDYIDYSQDRFDAGIWLQNINVKFSAGANVVCKYTGNNANVPQYFSAFATGNNVTIDGLVLDCENLRYAIHADYNSGTDETFFIVKNCDLSHYKNPTSMQAIGAGLGRHVFWLIENTIFRSSGGNHIVCRIHNNVNSDAKSKVIVKDCYIDGDGYFKFEPYSLSTDITIAQVCGCSYKTAPVVERLTSDSNDNIVMIAWNNEIRS